MRRGAADDGDDNRGTGEAAALDLDQFGRKLGLDSKPQLQQFLADAGTLGAAIDDQSPWRQLAVIGHPHSQTQDLLQLRLGRTGVAHLEGRDGAAYREIVAK